MPADVANASTRCLRNPTRRSSGGMWSKYFCSDRVRVERVPPSSVSYLVLCVHGQYLDGTRLLLTQPKERGASGLQYEADLMSHSASTPSAVPLTASRLTFGHVWNSFDGRSGIWDPRASAPWQGVFDTYLETYPFSSNHSRAQVGWLCTKSLPHALCMRQLPTYPILQLTTCLGTARSHDGKKLTVYRSTEFMLLHSPSTFNAERLAWRFVIYLNLVRSIRRYVSSHRQKFPAPH